MAKTKKPVSTESAASEMVESEGGEYKEMFEDLAAEMRDKMREAKEARERFEKQFEEMKQREVSNSAESRLIQSPSKKNYGRQVEQGFLDKKPCLSRLYILRHYHFKILLRHERKDHLSGDQTEVGVIATGVDYAGPGRNIKSINDPGICYVDLHLNPNINVTEDDIKDFNLPEGTTERHDDVNMSLRDAVRVFLKKVKGMELTYMSEARFQKTIESYMRLNWNREDEEAAHRERMERFEEPVALRMTDEAFAEAK